jgi:hypothetical protein
LAPLIDSHGSPQAGEAPHVNQDQQRLHVLEIDGIVIATARMRADGS